MIILVDFLPTKERYAFYNENNRNDIKAVKGFFYKKLLDMGYSKPYCAQIIRDNVTNATPHEYDAHIFDHYINKNSVAYWRNYYDRYYDIYQAYKYRTYEKVLIVH